MSLHQAPSFRASPAPTEEEAAAIAVALVSLLEEAARSQPTAGPAVLSPWVADSRAAVARRGVWDYRHTVDPRLPWRLSGRAGVWGVMTVQR